MSDWIIASIVLVILAALMPIASRLKRFGVSAEWTRKFVHISMGLICSIFPWLFKTDLVVWSLSGLAILSMLLIRHVKFIKSQVGDGLHSVDRISYGEIFFPIAVAISWSISDHNWIIYTPSILVLALADAGAAIIGKKYGKHPFKASDGIKSIEGCLCFLVITFLILIFPSFHLQNEHWPLACFTALTISLLVMLFEAASWRGIDNFLIPLAVCYFIQKYPQFSAVELLERCLVISTLCSFVIFARSRSTLDSAALLGATLFAYGLFFLGQDWRFLIGPFIIFIFYTKLSPTTAENKDQNHDVQSVISTCMPSLLWVAFLDHPQIIWMSHACFLGQFCCISVARLAFDFPDKNRTYICLRSSIIPFLLLTIPFYMSGYSTQQDLFFMITLLPASVITTFLFWKLQPNIRDCPSNLSRWFRQTLIGASTCLLPLVFIS